MNENRIILPISPQTNFRTTQGTKKLFQIPEVCYKGENGEGCESYRSTGLCEHTLSKTGRRIKKRIDRYNKYKVNVLSLAKRAGFQLPTCGWAIYFYLPIAKHVPLWKRKLLHGQLHQGHIDVDNMYKAVADSLSITDERISQLSGLGKFWVDTVVTKDRNGKKKVGSGWIEILLNQPIYNPFEVSFIDQKSLIKMKDEKVQRKKMQPKPRKKKRRTHSKKRNEFYKSLHKNLLNENAERH